MEKIKNKYSSIYSLDEKIRVSDFITGSEEKLFAHPILMKNISEYKWAQDILTIEKEKISFSYIKYSYYDFICKYIVELSKTDKQQAEVFVSKLSAIFSLSLKDNFIAGISYIEDSGGRIELIRLTEENLIKIEKNEELKSFLVKKESFDELRYLIIYQNDSDFFDMSDYSNDMQELIEKNRKKKTKEGELITLEDKIDSLIVGAGLTMEEIKNLSIRRFERVFERMHEKIEYTILKTAINSGFVSLKTDRLKNWSATIDKNPLKGLMVDYDSVKGKIK